MVLEELAAPPCALFDEVEEVIADLGALDSARYAVRGCPRQALKIERISEQA